MFMVPRAVVGSVSGQTERAIGSAIALAFWAWPTWRSVLLLRQGDREQDPRYWFVSAAGYAVFLAVRAALWGTAGARIPVAFTRGDGEARSASVWPQPADDTVVRPNHV